MGAVESPSDAIERLARQRVERTGIPLLLLVPETIDCEDEVAVHRLCSGTSGPLEVLLGGSGGRLEAAYGVARVLGRRDASWTALVPARAKSALTLVALSAPELVLGDLGELGPLDAQSCDRQQADFPVDRSCLELFTGVACVAGLAEHVFSNALHNVLRHSQLAAGEACRIAGEVAAGIVRPLLAGVDVQEVGRRERVLRLGELYLMRALSRFRPDLPVALVEKLAHHIVREYPGHGFALDREELRELGLPVRSPEPQDREWFDEVGVVLSSLEPGAGLGPPELFEPAAEGADHARTDDPVGAAA